MKQIDAVKNIPCMIHQSKCFSNQVHSRVFGASAIEKLNSTPLIFKQINCQKVADSVPRLYLYLLHQKHCYVNRKLKTSENRQYQFSFYKKRDAEIFYLIRIFKEGQPLSRRIRKLQSEILDLKYLQSFAKQMISFLVSYQGLPTNIMTANNIFVDQFGTMEFNFTSFVGIRFILLKQSIAKNEFLEIYPYLDSQIFKRNRQQRLNGIIQIRSLAVNLLKIIAEEDIAFEQNLNTSTINPNSEDCLRLIDSLKQNFRRFLQNENVLDRIKLAEEESGMRNLLKFFTSILVKQDKSINYENFLSQCLGLYDEQKHIQQLVNLNQLHQKFIKMYPPSKNAQQLKLNTFSTYIPAVLNLQFIDLINPQHWWISILNKNVNNNFSMLNEFCEKIIYKMRIQLTGQIENKQQVKKQRLTTIEKPQIFIVQFMKDSNLVARLILKKMEYFHEKTAKEILNVHSDYKLFGRVT